MKNTRDLVIEHMVEANGIFVDEAQEMCDRFPEIIRKGENLISYPYYIAFEVMRAEKERLNLEDLPEDYYDPDWEEEEEEEEDGYDYD
jgi:hypothetical protein